MTEESREPQTSTFWTTAMAVLDRAGRFLKWLVGKMFHRARKIGTFYWSHRKAFRAYISEYSPGLQEPRIVRREIRFFTDDESKLARYSKEGWVIELPERCVVCGEPTDCKPINDSRWIDNLGKPFWMPVAAIGGGFILSLVFHTYWIFLVATLFGFVLGNLSQSSIRIDLQFRRCKLHEKKTNVPHVRLFGEQLILRVGSKSARQAFRDKTQYPEDTLVGTHKKTIRTSDPDPIPLADEVSGEIKHEDTIPLASSEPLAEKDADSDWTIDDDIADDLSLDDDVDD